MRRSSLLLLGTAVLVALALAAGCGGSDQAGSSAPSPGTPTRMAATDTGTPATDPPAEPEENTISWSEAKRLIAQCEVGTVFQTHSLRVSLGLRNGSRRTTREPQIDDVLHLLAKAEPRCGSVGALVE